MRSAAAPTSNLLQYCFFFFFNDTATTEIYTLSLHDALPILFIAPINTSTGIGYAAISFAFAVGQLMWGVAMRSEEHTSELQSLTNLVCRLLLEKKKMVQVEQDVDGCTGRPSHHQVLVFSLLK